MGEQFLRKQAHGFRHGHDAAFDKMKIPTLISTTTKDVMAREFRCDASDMPDVNVEVTLSGRGEKVNVMMGGRVVGQVARDEAAALQPALEIGCGVLRAKVASRSAITPSFVVRLQDAP